MLKTLLPAPAVIENINSLMNRANIIRPGDDKWESGASVVFTGKPVFVHGNQCWANVDEEIEKPLHECTPAEEFVPFLLQTGYLGAGLKAVDLKGLAAKDIATASNVIEKAHLQGVASSLIDPFFVYNDTDINTARAVGIRGDGDYRYLQEDAVGVSSSNALDVAEAITRIEDRFVEGLLATGGGGVIYLTPTQVAQGRHALRWDKEGLLWTRATGSKVIVGNFFDDTSVYGHAGDLDVYLSSVEVFEAFDRRTNRNYEIAEQYVMPVWNVNAAFESSYEIEVP